MDIQASSERAEKLHTQHGTEVSVTSAQCCTHTDLVLCLANVKKLLPDSDLSVLAQVGHATWHSTVMHQHCSHPNAQPWWDHKLVTHNKNTNFYLKLTYKYAVMQEQGNMTHVVRLNRFLWKRVEIVALPEELWHHPRMDHEGQRFYPNSSQMGFLWSGWKHGDFSAVDKKGQKEGRTLRKWTTLSPLAQANDFRTRWSWIRPTIG